MVIFSLETLNQMVVDGSCHSSTCQISARDFKLWTHSWLVIIGRPNSEQIREQLVHGRDNGGQLGHGVVTASKVLTHSGPGTGDPPVGRFERKQLSRD